MCTPKVVPGHKGLVVGDRQDMMRRTLLLSKPKLVYKTTWDPLSKSKTTKSYDATTGKIYSPPTTRRR